MSDLENRYQIMGNVIKVVFENTLNLENSNNYLRITANQLI